VGASAATGNGNDRPQGPGVMVRPVINLLTIHIYDWIN
jgi:hypothetical protein